MAKYIDKNATVGILEVMSRSADCECIKKRLEKAAKRVSAIPTADVAPVVRCKDCKHEFCGSCIICGFQKRKPDDFCSYGERKAGADNG